MITYYPGLTWTETQLLDLLERNRGRVLAHEEISAAIYGYTDGKINVFVNRVRKKMGRQAITTIRGYGFTAGAIHACEACEGRGWVVG